MQNISSFPTVDAHYCRAKTNKKYLEAGLNIQKMYDLYKEHCEEEKGEPVKDSYYRLIFRTEFNMDFHIPKTDQCNRCQQYMVKMNEGISISSDEEAAHVNHLSEKLL